MAKHTLGYQPSYGDAICPHVRAYLFLSEFSNVLHSKMYEGFCPFLLSIAIAKLNAQIDFI